MAECKAHRGFGNSGSNDESQWGVGNVMKRVAEQGSHILRGSAGSDEFEAVPKTFFTKQFGCASCVLSIAA